MNGDNLRRLRGVIGNAVVWGAGWFAAALAVLTVVGLARGAFSWHDSWQMAARTGVMGGIASAVFSGVIGLLYRGRRLSELHWIRFGIGGGIVAGVAVPAVMFVGRSISGDGPLPMENWVSSAIVAAVFGAVASAGSLKLAQRAGALPSGEREDRLGRVAGGDPWASVDVEAPRVRAERTDVRE